MDFLNILCIELHFFKKFIFFYLFTNLNYNLHLNLKDFLKIEDISPIDKMNLHLI